MKSYNENQNYIWSKYLPSFPFSATVLPQLGSGPETGKGHEEGPV